MPRGQVLSFETRFEIYHRVHVEKQAVNAVARDMKIGPKAVRLWGKQRVDFFSRNGKLTSLRKGVVGRNKLNGLIMTSTCHFEMIPVKITRHMLFLSSKFIETLAQLYQILRF